jgi:hypothetical protein
MVGSWGKGEGDWVRCERGMELSGQRDEERNRGRLGGDGLWAGRWVGGWVCELRGRGNSGERIEGKGVVRGRR